MAIDLSLFQESFFTESAEHVETMESGLLALEQRPQGGDVSFYRHCRVDPQNGKHSGLAPQ
jgi:chemotaxis protein histidine kinase CheA